MKKIYFYLTLPLFLLSCAMAWPAHEAVIPGREPTQVAERAEAAKREEAKKQEELKRQRDIVEQQRQEQHRAFFEQLAHEQAIQRNLRDWAADQQLKDAQTKDLPILLGEWKPGSFEEWQKGWSDFTHAGSYLPWKYAGPLSQATPEQRARLLEYLISKIPEPKLDSHIDFKNYTDTFARFTDQIVKMHTQNLLSDPENKLPKIILEKLSKIPEMLTEKTRQLASITLDQVFKDLNYITSLYKAISERFKLDSTISPRFKNALDTYTDLTTAKIISNNSNELELFIPRLEELLKKNPELNNNIQNFKAKIFERYLDKLRKEFPGAQEAPAQTKNVLNSIKRAFALYTNKRAFTQASPAIEEMISKHIELVSKYISGTPAEQFSYFAALLRIPGDKARMPEWFLKAITGALAKNFTENAKDDALSGDLQKNAAAIETLKNIQKLLNFEKEEQLSSHIAKIIKKTEENQVQVSKKIIENIQEQLENRFKGLKNALASEAKARGEVIEKWKTDLLKFKADCEDIFKLGYEKNKAADLAGYADSLLTIITSRETQDISRINFEADGGENLAKSIRDATNDLIRNLNYNLQADGRLRDFDSRRTIMERQQTTLEILIRQFQEKMSETDLTYLQIASLLTTENISDLAKKQPQLIKQLLDKGLLVSNVPIIAEGVDKSSATQYQLTRKGTTFIEALRPAMSAQGRAAQLKAYLKDNKKAPDVTTINEQYGHLADFVKNNRLELLIIDDQVSILRNMFETVLKAAIPSLKDPASEWIKDLRKSTLFNENIKATLQDILDMLNWQKDTLKKMDLSNLRPEEDYYFTNFASIILDMTKAENDAIYKIFLEKFPALISALTGVETAGTLFDPALQKRVLRENADFGDELSRLSNPEKWKELFLAAQEDIEAALKKAEEGTKSALSEGAWAAFWVKWGMPAVLAVAGTILLVVSILCPPVAFLAIAAYALYSFAGNWAAVGNWYSNITSVGVGISVAAKKTFDAIKNEPENARILAIREVLISVGEIPAELPSPRGTAVAVVQRAYINPFLDSVKDFLKKRAGDIRAKQHSISEKTEFVRIAKTQYFDFINKYLSLQGKERLSLASTSIECEKAEKLVNLKIEGEPFLKKGDIKKLLENKRQNIIIMEKAYVEAEFTYTALRYEIISSILKENIDTWKSTIGQKELAYQSLTEQEKAEEKTIRERLATFETAFKAVEIRMKALADIFKKDKKTLQVPFGKDADKVYKEWHNILAGNITFMNQLFRKQIEESGLEPSAIASGLSAVDSGLSFVVSLMSRITDHVVGSPQS